jgi:hypothetical protein
MNMYLFFKNLNILCIFSDRFFDPVFFRFGSQFLGSTGSMTGSVLVTVVYWGPSQGSFPPWYKTMDQPMPQAWVPWTFPGALDISKGFSCLVSD